MRGKLIPIGGRIERYVVSAIAPYFGLALLLLTAILLIQQSFRFIELLGMAGTSFNSTIELLSGLLPNVLVFTLPMAALIGTAIGFSQMGSDSEMVAMRAAGIGTFKIVAPVLQCGVMVTVITLLVGMKLAPDAAHALRVTGLRAALRKLDSPVDLRSFNLDLTGKVVYVRDGDRKEGQWGRVFMYWHDGDVRRLITARSGRIDSSTNQSELVLSDSEVMTLSTNVRTGKDEYTFESSDSLRLRDDRLNAARNSLLNNLHQYKLEVDEMSWGELRAEMQSTDESAGRKAAVALHKRLALCFAPLTFALMGGALGANIRRGGRAIGLLMSICLMVLYYLLSIAGEQLARSGTVPPVVGAWLATIIFVSVGGVSLVLFDVRHLGFGSWKTDLRSSNGSARGFLQTSLWVSSRARWPSLLDWVVVRSLLSNLIISCLSLSAIFYIFTLFELTRYLAARAVSAWVVASYLFYLLPFVAVALAPMTLLVASIVTYALMARRSETVAWWACGQSTYRLALPGLMLGVCLGGVVWWMHENVLPSSNIRQDDLRAQIRGGAVKTGAVVGGRQWLAFGNSEQLFSYLYNSETGDLTDVQVYQFDREGVHLSRVIQGAEGKWETPTLLRLPEARVVNLDKLGGPIKPVLESSLVLRTEITSDVFKPSLKKASHMNSSELSNYIRMLKARGGSGELASMYVARERKAAEPFGAFVMSLLAIPLALAFGRNSAVMAVTGAIIVGLGYWGITQGLLQLGNYGLLPVSVAVWSPLAVFGGAGLYLLFRTKT